jgi:threonine synthase
MSYFTHLECSVPCGAGPYDPRVPQHLCSCGAPLLARYDLAAARGWRPESLVGREPTMWRYRELMPLFDGEQPLTLGEGWTPLVHARRLGAALGLDRLYIKDESLNPTNSFKARGLSAAVTRAAHLKARTLSVPSAGNAANAMAAYAALGGLQAQVFMPRDVKVPFIRECELYGATVTLVDGLITDAGRIAAEQGKPRGWYDVSTLKEPYRIEGKKTMAYEIGEQLDWHFPDGRGHRDGRHVEGLRRAGADRLEAFERQAENGVGPGRQLRADRSRIRAGRRTLGALARRPHHRRRAASAESNR